MGAKNSKRGDDKFLKKRGGREITVYVTLRTDLYLLVADYFGTKFNDFRSKLMAINCTDTKNLKFWIQENAELELLINLIIQSLGFQIQMMGTMNIFDSIDAITKYKIICDYIQSIKNDIDQITIRDNTTRFLASFKKHDIQFKLLTSLNGTELNWDSIVDQHQVDSSSADCIPGSVGCKLTTAEILMRDPPSMVNQRLECMSDLTCMSMYDIPDRRDLATMHLGKPQLKALDISKPLVLPLTGLILSTEVIKSQIDKYLSSKSEDYYRKKYDNLADIFDRSHQHYKEQTGMPFNIKNLQMLISTTNIIIKDRADILMDQESNNIEKFLSLCKNYDIIEILKYIDIDPYKSRDLLRNRLSLIKLLEKLEYIQLLFNIKPYFIEFYKSIIPDDSDDSDDDRWHYKPWHYKTEVIEEKELNELIIDQIHDSLRDLGRLSSRAGTFKYLLYYMNRGLGKLQFGDTYFDKIDLYKTPVWDTILFQRIPLTAREIKLMRLPNINTLLELYTKREMMQFGYHNPSNSLLLKSCPQLEINLILEWIQETTNQNIAYTFKYLLFNMNQELGRYLFRNGYFDDIGDIMTLHSTIQSEPLFPKWEDLRFITTVLDPNLGERDYLYATPKIGTGKKIRLADQADGIFVNERLRDICPGVDIIIDWIQQSMNRDLHPFHQLTTANKESLYSRKTQSSVQISPNSASLALYNPKNVRRINDFLEKKV